MRITQIQPMRDSQWGNTTHRLVAAALACGVLAGWAWTASARGADRHATLTGPARVVDGDTIVVSGVRVRLEGIDAPEAGQTCHGPLPGEVWPCGTAAATALLRLIGTNDVSCRRHGLDRYGRMLGVCFLGQEDINATMVREGHAWAFTRYSMSYVGEEAQARARRVGIWQGAAVPAWEYRARHWTSAEPHAPQGCAIKGNVTQHGKIYHMPWSPWYAQIRIDPDKGRRWFCTEAEALAAGWRPVNLR
jgi:endonuclease YncB( thermonuclease family)